MLCAGTESGNGMVMTGKFTEILFKELTHLLLKVVTVWWKLRGETGQTLKDKLLNGPIK